MIISNEKMCYSFVGVAVLLIATGLTNAKPVTDAVDESQHVVSQTSTPREPQVISAQIQQEQTVSPTDIDEARNCTFEALSIVLTTSGGTVSDKCRELLRSLMANTGKVKQRKEFEPAVDLKGELKDLVKAEDTYGIMHDEIENAQELLSEKGVSTTSRASKLGRTAMDGAGLKKGSSEYDYRDGFGNSDFLVNSAGVGLLEDMTSAKGQDSDFIIIPISFLRKQFMLQESEDVKAGQEVKKDPSEEASKDTDADTLTSWLLRVLLMTDALPDPSKGSVSDKPQKESDSDSEGDEEEDTDEGEDDSSNSEEEEKEPENDEKDGEEEEGEKEKKEDDDEEEKEEDDNKTEDSVEKKTQSEIPGFDAAALERLESDISILGKDLAMLQPPSNS